MLAAVVAGVLTTAFAAAPRERRFDSDWRFLRGDAPGAENPAFRDSDWRVVDLPHDWSIEDLPPQTNAVPELPAVTGEWRFHAGDDAGWKAREFDDHAWQRVSLPEAWEQHSGYTNDFVYGWYRRNLGIPSECRGRDFDLLLGRIDDADEVWLNGERIGGSGSFPPNFSTAWSLDRRYRVPASLVRGDGSNVLAVRVFDGENGGGIISEGIKTSRIGPFDTLQSKGGHFTGYTVGGVGWYRKHFTIDETNRQVAVRFDGVYMNSELWINGQRLGEHPHGYTSFEFDLTPYLKPPGQDNVLAVCVRNEGRNSRWYSGSGIYRHVWLIAREPVGVPTWGLFVTTPEVFQDKATVKASVEVRNTTDAGVASRIRVRLLDAKGRLAGQSEEGLQVAANETRALDQTLEVQSPMLWSPESPSLYLAEVEVVVADKVTDRVSTHFGIRKLEFDAEHGFRLNGNPVLLRGGNVHHDNGPLGAAAIDRAEERKIELLKANGFNAVRSAHNPPSPALLDACDRLGMLAIVEAFDQWNESKERNDQDYHRFFKEWSDRDIASMVRRDRNHPSVIMWSIGNEIPEQFRAGTIPEHLREAVLSHDTTRPVTQAICSDWGKVAQDWDKLSDPAFSSLDVAGYNYLPGKYESDHARHPQRVMYASESFPKDALEYWSLVETYPYVVGDFVWTAMDYLGEAGIAHALLSNQPDSFFMSWPWFNAWCGDLDLCGFKKPQSYYRDVVWRRSRIEMAVHTPIPDGLTENLSWWGWPDEMQSWNWAGQDGKPLRVSVYSRCERVRLELNGKVIGEQPVSEQTKLTATFEVPYAPGQLRAYGMSGGVEVARTTFRTSGAPKRLKLTADRSGISADRNDLAYVTVEVVDAEGQRVPDAAVPVRFKVAGVGELAGQASGNPIEPDSFKAMARRTFEGRCIAILRPVGGVGKITLGAEADGLEDGSITVEVQPSGLANVESPSQDSL